MAFGVGGGRLVYGIFVVGGEGVGGVCGDGELGRCSYADTPVLSLLRGLVAGFGPADGAVGCRLFPPGRHGGGGGGGGLRVRE